ncbi:MAG TPA: NAD(P)-dependent alcohol dehydrogenase [Candidatus Dormibacteraeota bacterium]|nr:NAD(P)-dependent alcohol dehydrogenase [Candidatus Dormibacteraeota bacterium]
MKAIVQEAYGSPDVLEFRDIDKPVIGANDVLVRVRAAGVNPADWALVGGLPYIARPLYGMGKPKNPVRGTDVAGEVEAVGASVTRFRPGDEVFGWSGHLGGAFAEYVSVSEDALVTKPAKLTFEQAAAVPMAGTVALLAVRDHGKVQAGQKVLINGASGGIGSFAVQIANALGAEVTGVCSTRNMDLVRSIGAEHVIDYTKVDFTRTGQRYDFILDNVANRSLSDLRRALTPKGTLVPNGGGFDHRWMASGGRLIRAKVSFAFVRQSVRTFIASSKQQNLVALKELVEAGKIRPVIDRTYALNETPQAIAYVGQGHARGKVVITVKGVSS